MKLDDLNRWLALVANVGVVTGIVFLAVELRQNNDLLEAQARADRRDIDRAAARRDLDYPDLRRAKLKARKGMPLDDEDRYLLELAARASLRDWSYIFLEVQEGTLPASALHAEGWRETFERDPTMQEIWSDAYWTPEFRQWLEENVVNERK